MKLVRFSAGKDSEWLECHKQTCKTKDTKCSSGGEESCAEQELNGLVVGEGAITDEEGEGVDGEGEAGTVDWRVRAGPRNTPTAREREEHEATHMLFGDWCTHCMIGRGRTHHHVSKKRVRTCRRYQRKPRTNFLMPHSTADSQAIPDESVTCVAVKEDRHHNIVSSAHQLVGYKEITLKRDTERAIVAFRNRVENCNAEVTLEDAVKGDKPSNGLVENAVMLLRGVISKCHVESCRQEELREDSQTCRGFWNMRGASCPGVRRVETVGRHLSDCMARSRHKSLCHSGRRCWGDQYPQNW